MIPSEAAPGQPHRLPIVPIALGFLLVGASAADSYELMTWAPNDDWWLCVRIELELLGGLWLLFGFFPRSTRIMSIGSFGSMLVFDLARLNLAYPARDIFGQIMVGPWWLLCGDIAIVVALISWRPSMSREPWIDSHPARLAATVVIALALGAASDWSQLGRFPLMATVPTQSFQASPGLSYLTYLPAGYYRSMAYWPLLLDLHGSGGVGHDISRVRARGLPRKLESGQRLPFIVVAPQCPKQGWEPAPLDLLLDEVLQKYRVDPNRVYLTGNSMGGYGVWAMASAHPERFAAIAPICGGGDPALANRLAGVSTWAFHGAEDLVIPADESRKMVSAQQCAGGEAKLTIYPGIGHDAATPTYGNPALYDWLLAHQRRSGKAESE